MPQFIPNFGMRMVEAAVKAAAPDGLKVRVWDFWGGDAAVVADEVAAFDPDIVGFSVYLWSFPFFLDVARRLKGDDPKRLIIFGGPSARPVMLDKVGMAADARAIDALVIGEGEETFVDIVRLADRRPPALLSIPGVAVWEEGGWHETPARPLADLDALASPYRMGLVQHGGLGVLQTYRGCPFTCSFCEWGVMDSPKRVRDVARLGAELSAIERHRVQAALLVDAGLNLNKSAFENLRRAADETGFFARRGLICEVYPAAVRQEHLEFLGSVGNAYVGIGLQSFDNQVLANVERKYDEARFDETFAKLSAVSSIAVEIILGLPGDSPERFRRSYERARRLKCALRVYHCVVLPSALMVRSPPSHALRYDPMSLKMESCLGWSEAALARECSFLDAEARKSGGRRGEFFWTFPPAAERRLTA